MKDLDFTDIYNEYAPRIFRVCMGYVNDPMQAQDLLQETFINVWKGLPSFRQEAALSTWIFRIASNICLRHVEKSKKILLDALPYNIPIVEERVQDDRIQLLYRNIGALEETDRLIISLFLEEISQGEIAEIVGTSIGNVRVKIHRIKEKLQKKMTAHGKPK